MKHVLIAGFAGAFLASTTLADHHGEAAMTEAEIVAQGIYAAFATGDVPAFAGYLHPEVVWNEAENYIYADNNPYIGPDAVLEGVIGRTVAEWDSFTATPEHMISNGNEVAVMGRYTGTNLATGEYMDLQFVHVMTVENGQVTSFQQYTDTLQAFNAATPGD
jgi:ketosteroid isomerase-like protein